MPKMLMSSLPSSLNRPLRSHYLGTFVYSKFRLKGIVIENSTLCELRNKAVEKLSPSSDKMRTIQNLDKIYSGVSFEFIFPDMLYPES